jgi:anti-anti-sigma factor
MPLEIGKRELRLSSDRPAIIIDISGDLDFEGEEVFSAYIREFEAIRETMVALNLEKLNIANSTGLSLIRKFNAVVVRNGGRLAAYAPNSMLEMVIKLTKADLFIKILPNQSEALKYLEGNPEVQS